LAVPFRKTSKAKKRKRRFHLELKPKNLILCKNCGVFIKMHRVCNQCGFYKDNEIIKK